MQQGDASITDILEQYKDIKFSWGTMDCCIFAGKVLEEYHDKEILGDIVGSYSTWEGALKTIEKLGKGKIQNLPSAFIGTKQKNIMKAKTGDMVYMEEDGHGIIGVCSGVRAYFLQKGKGLTARNISNCLYCWSID